nr:putative extracellular protein CSOL_013 [Pseudococcomyxa simplex]
MALLMHRMLPPLLVAICLGLFATTAEANGTLESCNALIKIPGTWAAGDHYSASINVAVQNTGSKDWPAGTYDVVISNANLIDIKNTWGWTYNHAADGDASGTITLANAVAPSAQTDIGAIMDGTSPQNFYPVQILVDGRKCHLQQDPSMTAGR